jgi:hypothetical protein
MQSSTHSDGVIEEVSCLVVDRGEVDGFAHGSIVGTDIDCPITEES